MNPGQLTDYLTYAVFAVAVSATVLGALIAVLTSRIIRSVGGLAICCCGLAGLYYFLNSPFLTLMEILIYVGAICVTIIFAVMLAEPDATLPPNKTTASIWWAGSALVTCTLAFAGVAYLGLTYHWTLPVVRTSSGSVKDIGVSLLSTYSLSFELISLVLLVSVLGALVVAREGRNKI